MAKYDKNGGNVTTNHNFKKDIVATKEDETRNKEWKYSTSSNNYSKKNLENPMIKILKQIEMGILFIKMVSHKKNLNLIKQREKKYIVN